MLTHDDGCQPIAIGHLSYSGDIKRAKVCATFAVLEGKRAMSQDARMVVVIGVMWLLLPLVCDASLQCDNCPYELGVYSCTH